MRRLGPILLLALPLAGCMVDGRPNAPESTAREPLRDRMAGQLARLLSRDLWSGEIVERTAVGRVSANPSDPWAEDVLTFDVLAADADGDPVAVPAEDTAAILGTLRRRIRDVVEELGGEQTDWEIREGYQERVLTFQYKIGGMIGAVVARAFPTVGERPAEPLTRFEITVREKPAPAQ